jgi:hypothetical protein
MPSASAGERHVTPAGSAVERRSALYSALCFQGFSEIAALGSAGTVPRVTTTYGKLKSGNVSGLISRTNPSLNASSHLRVVRIWRAGGSLIHASPTINPKSKVVFRITSAGPGGSR